MQCSKHHFELDENGEGKCSVPMWQGGCPAGFCDKTAYGKPTPCETFRDRDGRLSRMDGKYNGYVPGLACSDHGGPEKPKAEAKKKELEEQQRIRTKYIKKNVHKSFSWNAKYHMREAKQHRKDALYHDEKAKLCKERAKEK